MKKLIAKTLGVFLLACFFVTSSVFAGYSAASGGNIRDAVIKTVPAKPQTYHNADYYRRHHKHHKHHTPYKYYHHKKHHKKHKKYPPKPYPKYKKPKYHAYKPKPKPAKYYAYHPKHKPVTAHYPRRPDTKPLPPLHKPGPKPVKHPPVVMNPKN